MTRHPSAKDIKTIAAVTRAREQAALAQIAKAAARREKAAQAVAELLAINPEAKSATEAELISRWLLWKQSELKNRNIELAASEADFQKTVRHAGRQIAEHAVMTELLERAKREADRARLTQANLTFLDEQSR